MAAGVYDLRLGILILVTRRRWTGRRSTVIEDARDAHCGSTPRNLSLLLFILHVTPVEVVVRVDFGLGRARGACRFVGTMSFFSPIVRARRGSMVTLTLAGGWTMVVRGVPIHIGIAVIR